MENINELEYLRTLNQKYGRYWKKYFGFTAHDIAKRLGMDKFKFSKILSGGQKLAPELEPILAQVFKDLNILEKTKEFKESNSQKWQREHNYLLRKENT